MERSKIDIFLMQNGHKFPASKIALVEEALVKLDDDQFKSVQYLDYKEPTSILILSAIMGNLGVDRFVLGEVAYGILKLITFGGFYVWWILDAVSAEDRTKEYNFNLMMQTLACQGLLKIIY